VSGALETGKWGVLRECGGGENRGTKSWSISLTSLQKIEGDREEERTAKRDGAQVERLIYAHQKKNGRLNQIQTPRLSEKSTTKGENGRKTGFQGDSSY